MKVAVVLAMIVCGACAFSLSDDWEWAEYKRAFNKIYVSEVDELERRDIFKARVASIERHNVRFHQGLETYEQGINQFSDMLPGEVPKGAIVPDTPSGNPVFVPSSYVAPKTVDWRKKGYVTPVKNQGSCGSCWAFSATGAIEGQHFKKTKKLVSLSEQNLVDCSGQEGDEGCNGGWPDWAYKYVVKAHGIDTEKNYPYTAEDGNCKFDKNGVGATMKRSMDIKHDNETDLTLAIAKKGPISVCIDASGDGFMSYKSGVYTTNDCGNTRNSIDHCVLAVGYGTTKSGQAYYIVKNSWGTSWGDKGYILMARNLKNHCAIASQAQFPVV